MSATRKRPLISHTKTPAAQNDVAAPSKEPTPPPQQKPAEGNGVINAAVQRVVAAASTDTATVDKRSFHSVFSDANLKRLYVGFAQGTTTGVDCKVAIRASEEKDARVPVSQSCELLDVNDDTVGIPPPYTKEGGGAQGAQSGGNNGPESGKFYIRALFEGHKPALDELAGILAAYEELKKKNPSAPAPENFLKEQEAMIERIEALGEVLCRACWKSSLFQASVKKELCGYAKQVVSALHGNKIPANDYSDADPEVQERAYESFRLNKFKGPIKIQKETGKKCIEFTNYAWSPPAKAVSGGGGPAQQPTAATTTPQPNGDTANGRGRKGKKRGTLPQIPLVFTDPSDQKEFERLTAAGYTYQPLPFYDCNGEFLARVNCSQRASRPGDLIKVQFYPSVYSQTAGQCGWRLNMVSIAIINRGPKIEFNKMVVTTSIGKKVNLFADDDDGEAAAAKAKKQKEEEEAAAAKAKKQREEEAQQNGKRTRDDAGPDEDSPVGKNKKARHDTDMELDNNNKGHEENDDDHQEEDEDRPDLDALLAQEENR
jgi:hypothetical protein